MTLAEKDYILYVQEYDEELSKTKKPRTSATIPGKIEHSGPPLDFSFLKLQDVQSLKKERPRAGKRKPIEKDDDEEDNKKNDALNPALGDEKLEGDINKEHKETGVVITKAAHVPAVTTVL